MARSDAAGRAVPESVRRRMLALIHVAKKQLGLDDEDYRTLLHSLTGKTSAGDCDLSELQAVLKAMEDLGFRPTAKPSQPKGKRYFPKTRDKDPDRKTQIDLIRALWLELSRRGIVKDSSAQSLDRFVKRRTGVERVEWLKDHKHCWGVITALQKWGEQNGVDWNEWNSRSE